MNQPNMNSNGSHYPDPQQNQIQNLPWDQQPTNSNTYASPYKTTPVIPAKRPRAPKMPANPANSAVPGQRPLPNYLVDWQNQFNTPAAPKAVPIVTLGTEPWRTPIGAGMGGIHGMVSANWDSGTSWQSDGASGHANVNGSGGMDWQSQFRPTSMNDATQQFNVASQVPSLQTQPRHVSMERASNEPASVEPVKQKRKYTKATNVEEGSVEGGSVEPVKQKRKYTKKADKNKPVQDAPVMQEPVREQPPLSQPAIYILPRSEPVRSEQVNNGPTSDEGQFQIPYAPPAIAMNEPLMDHNQFRTPNIPSAIERNEAVGIDDQYPAQYDHPSDVRKEPAMNDNQFWTPNIPSAIMRDEPARDNGQYQTAYNPPAPAAVEYYDVPMSGIEPENANNGLHDSVWDRELPGAETEDDFMDDEEDDPYYRDHAEKMKKLRKDILDLRENNQNVDFSSILDGTTAPRVKKKLNKSKEIKPRGRQVGQKVGVRKAAELSGDIKRRLARAVTLFQNEQEYEAAEALEEIIRLNAEVPAAWLLLAGIYEDDGQIDRALRCLIMAAHTSTKSMTPWINAAVLAESQHGPEREYYLSQAQFCYSAAIRNDPKSMECRRARAAILEERGKRKTAISEYRNIATREPADVESLRRLAELCIDHGKPQIALDTYKKSIKYFRTLLPEEAGAFDWTQVDTYITLFEVVKQYYSAIAELKSMSRWLLGREEDMFWNSITLDDSEWDTDETRKAKVPGYVSGKHPQEAYELPLEFRVRLGVYRLWIQHSDEALHHFYFLDPLNTTKEDKIQDYPHLFLQAAGELFKKELFEKALVFYEPLLAVPEYYDSHLFVQIGRCNLKLGNLERAEQLFKDAVLMDDNDVDARMEMARIHEKRNELHQALNFVNEAMILRKSQKRRELDEAQGLAEGEERVKKSYRPRVLKPKEPKEPQEPQEPQESQEPRVPQQIQKPKDPTDPKNLKERIAEPRVPRPPRVTVTESDRRQEVLSKGEVLINHYQTLRREHDAMRSEDKVATYAWLEAAKALTDDFRSCKAFYPWDKYIKFLGYSGESALHAATPLDTDLTEIADRLAKNLGADVSLHRDDLQSSIPTTYRDLAFSEWMNIFCEYALCLAKLGFIAECYDVCHAIRDAVVFYQTKEDKFLTHLVHGTCALLLSDEEICVAQARFFMREYQFTTDAYRMYAALSRSIHSPVSWYSSGPSQKFILRQIKCMDAGLMDDERKKRMAVSERGSYSATDEHGHLIINDDMDICLIMLYGQILYVGQSYAYALNYFYRAYALDPENPMIHLCIGLTYCHHALKRQCENRQHHILQGMTFLNMYHEARIQSDKLEERQEAHYNLARMYHMLGLNHLAIPYYQHVLDEVRDEGRSEREDLVVDTAYNLQTMYAIAGNTDLAREVTLKWLVC